MDAREKEIRLRQFDEIEKYARGEMAKKLKAKFAPPEPEPAPDEAAPEAPVDGDALDQESLGRLAAMAE